MRAFSDAWFGKIEFLTELKSPKSAVHFSLQQFLKNLISSNFAHFPNLGFPMDAVNNGNYRLLIFFSSEKIHCILWGLIKKGSNFGKRERKYANAWGGGGRARGQKSLQKHFYCIRFEIVTIFFHFVFTFLRF